MTSGFHPWLRCVGAALAAFGVMGAAAAAQGRRGAPPGGPPYDLAAEVTLTGTVVDVKVITREGLAGVHLWLRVEKETVEVDLGPEWFVRQEKYRLMAGDAIVVIGARVGRGPGVAVLAREVRRGQERMTFRDAKGIPRWAGRGRGGR